MPIQRIPLIPGKYYHIYNRACGFEKLFWENFNYEFFLERFMERLSGILYLYCYCLMPNHFHLLVGMKDLNIGEKSSQYYSRKFGDFFNSYTQSFNKYYKRHGSLFSQNFKRKEVDDITYRRMVVIYIHRNPLKHELVDDLRKWQHSSYQEILSAKPEICHGEDVISWFGNKEIFEFCHQMKTEITLGGF